MLLQHNARRSDEVEHLFELVAYINMEIISITGITSDSVADHHVATH